MVGGWSTWCARRGWESRVCSAVRWEGEGETLLLPMVECRRGGLRLLRRAWLQERRQIATSCHKGNSDQIIEKKNSPWGWQNTDTDYLERLRNLHRWRCSQLSEARAVLSELADPALRGLCTRWPPGSFPSSVVWWFCGVTYPRQG